MSPSNNGKNDQNEKVVINAIKSCHVTVYETRTQMYRHIKKSAKSAHVWGRTGPKCFANSYLPPPFWSIGLAFLRYPKDVLLIRLTGQLYQQITNFSHDVPINYLF